MGNVCSFSKGYGISKDDLSIEGTPCILYGELYTTYKTAIAKKIKSKTNLNPEKLFHSKENDVIIPCSGETAEDIATSVCIPYDDILLGGDLTVIRSNLDGAFLSNQLNSARKYDIARIAQGKSIVHLQAEELKKINIAFPSIEEQRKISGFIDLIDDRIAVQNKIISKYETLIKGLKNQLYSRKARFTSHNKIPFPKWEKKQLSEILSISTEKNGSQYSKEKVLSVSDEYGVVNQIKFQGKSFAGQDISNYKVVKSGQIIYTRSPLAAKPFGIIKIVGNEIGIVSPLYIVNTVNNGYDALFVFYLFDTPQSTNNYLKPLVRVGAKHTMNISNDEWLSGTVIIPCLEEQKMIAGVLQSIDKKISFEKKVLEILKEQKTYLLSKMFI